MDQGLSLPEPVARPISEDYPLALISAGSLFHTTDGAATAHSAVLQKAWGNGHLLMNPFDAGQLDLKEGDAARIASATGTITTRISLSAETPRGVVIGTHGPTVNLRPIFNLNDRDQNTGTPWLHRVNVKVEAGHERD
jgi:anaerobic selenocysteine-containing dehydrogenase